MASRSSPALCPTILNLDVSALDVARRALAQTFPKGRDERCEWLGRRRVKKANDRRRRWLSMGKRRPGCRAANNLHEITPSHCPPRSKTTLFGFQLPLSKQKIAISETGPNGAQQKSRAEHVSDGSDSVEKVPNTRAAKISLTWTDIYI